MLSDVPTKRRWPRSQRFSLSATGADAEAGYRAGITAARNEGTGREAFDAARARWAGPLGLQPDDGVCLGEVREGSVSLTQIVGAMDDAGQTKTDAIAALGRLWDAGLIQGTEGK